MPRPLAKALAPAVAVLVAAAACAGRPGDAAKPSPPGGLEVRAVRAVLSPDSGAVYLTVIDHGGEGDRLLRVETRAARMADFHESVLDRGVMRMAARPEGFAVPPGGTLELAPAGKHIMLVEPRLPAGRPGRLPLTLRFERAGAVAVEAVVTSPPGAVTEAPQP